MSNNSPTPTQSHTTSNSVVVNSQGYLTYVSPHAISQIFLPISFDPIFDLELPVKQIKVKEGNTEGYRCSICKDFYPMAELNQPDDATEYTRFSCYSCRKGLKTIFL